MQERPQTSWCVLRMCERTSDLVVCSAHERTNLRPRGVFCACANEPQTSWCVLRMRERTSDLVVCSAHARTTPRPRGVFCACANEPQTSWCVLRMRERPPYLVVCSIRIFRIPGYLGSGSQPDNERGHQQGVDDTHQQEHWAPNKKNRCRGNIGLLTVVF